MGLGVGEVEGRAEAVVEDGATTAEVESVTGGVDVMVVEDGVTAAEVESATGGVDVMVVEDGVNTAVVESATVRLVIQWNLSIKVTR